MFLSNENIPDFREEDSVDREINHHGTSVKASNVVGPKPGTITPIEEVLTIIPGSGNRNLVRNIAKEDLVARDEKKEIDARKEFYDTQLVIKKQLVLRRLEVFLNYGLPFIFFGFSFVYFIIGFSYKA